jgi:predicted NACHT family NTPase
MPIAETAAATASAATTAAVTTMFNRAIERVESIISGQAKSIGIKALAALQGYSPYLEDTYERVATYKTFANPVKPVSVMDHFVSVEFENRSTKNFNQDDLLHTIIEPSRIVISATAGYGKSMVMRFMALSMYENPRGRIPLFLELRHLNRVTSPNIITFIHSTYRRISDVQIESLKQGLSAGAFVIMLDGFDELNHDIRPIIESQILEISRAYPLCSIIVSGRPDERFNAWREFTTFKIKPMSRSSVTELLKKLDYDRGTTNRFITKINKGLYETHESFLSTPLLAILMLLTFELNANIPDKLHLFYAKAFETLFHKHDALKEQYERSRKSGLQIDEFERIFSVFCLKTYVLEKTEFTKSEILKFLGEALTFEGQSMSAEDYLFDIEEAVCLIMKEGTSYFFVHRSFQEYFTAAFLSNAPESIRDEFVDQVSSRHWDNVLPMLFDMAQTQIEPSWVKRSSDAYLSIVSPTKKDMMRPIFARYSSFTFYRTARDEKDGGEVYFSDANPGPFSKFVTIMRRFYREKFESVGVDVGHLEQYARNNWDSLVCTYENDFEAGGGRKYLLKTVSVESIDDALKDAGIHRIANAEFNTIRRIRKELDEDQEARNAFLNNLFNNKK